MYLVIEEEYGFRYWLAEINKEEDLNNLVNWWENLESVLGMFFNPANLFPLTLKEITDENEELFNSLLTKETMAAYIHLHEDNDSWLKVIGKEKHLHAGYRK
ncbi:TPA: hypothetical protein HA278_04205 [Candidatus Woesearchaeota archaeon]|nr:hypothetical protein [Candidatus Woesearchaeota archaeon]